MDDELKALLLGNSETLEEATKSPEVKEFTEEELAVINLGIEPHFARIWYKHGPGKDNKKIFKYDKFLAKNVTKGFLDFVIDRVTYQGLKQIDIPQFPENLQTVIISAIAAIKSDATGDTDKLYKQIAELQETRDQLKKNLEGNMAVCIKYELIARRLIIIFSQQGIKADLTEEEIETIKELSS
jgi:hypothetical protein